LRHSGAARRCQERGKRDAQHGDDGGRVCGRRRRHRSIRSSCPALQVHPTQLRNWVKAFADDPQDAVPGHGRMKPDQLETARLKREVIKLKAENPKKAAAYFAKEST
jgi:transposase-like protein